MKRTSLVVAALVVMASVTPVRAAAAGAPPARPARFTVHGSVGQVTVTGAPPAAHLVLVDRDSRVVARGTVDRAGSLLFRDVTAGTGYRVEAASQRGAVSAAVRVLRADQPPSPGFYTAQRLDPGYQYLTTRDGTKLAVDVRLPGPPDRGPYPTVIEYSGYDPANPDDVQPASQIAQSLGYATVGVNMRGTGCSGGAWNYFEPLQSLDGYDAIEVVAAQPWVLQHRVGMVGISYPGITQLFVAATRPPHLAAITPLSVIDDTYRGVLYPGGILNSGFALSWAKDRQADARPWGQHWAQRRIDAGDQVCKTNQALRLQTPDVLAQIRSNRYYDPHRLDGVTPYLFVHRITVPTFLAGAWQDDETGGHWPDMISQFSPRTKLRVTITNGTHSEPLLPAIVTRWAEFLDFYVAGRIPRVPPVLRAAAPATYARVIGTPVPLPPDRFAGETSFATALAHYEAEPPIRVLFDNGAGGAPGAPVPGFEASLGQWPAKNLRPTRLYFAAGGRLRPQPPTRGAQGIDRYRYDPRAMPATSHPSPADDLFSALPAYDWRPLPNGRAVSFVSEPLARDTVMLGPGSVDLWLKSTARDVDLEVTLSEVRPDGKETYVQSGWLRASHRRLDAASSTVLEPRQTHTHLDAAPLPPGRFTRVRIPIFPFGHAFRAGSRVRITVQAPGGNRPRWAFDALPAHGVVTNEIARAPGRASDVVLPVATGIGIPTPLPPCPALRGQPCRDYVVPKEEP